MPILSTPRSKYTKENVPPLVDIKPLTPMIYTNNGGKGVLINVAQQSKASFSVVVMTPTRRQYTDAKWAIETPTSKQLR